MKENKKKEKRNEQKKTKKKCFLIIVKPHFSLSLSILLFTQSISQSLKRKESNSVNHVSIEKMKKLTQENSFT